MISLDKFKESDIRVGTIVSAEKIEGADKLLKLMVDVGIVGREAPHRGLKQIDTQIDADSPAEQKVLVQILSGIAQFYDPAVLVGKQVPVIVNLEPRTLKGHESHGMMLAAVVDGKPVLLHPDSFVPPGSVIQ